PPPVAKNQEKVQLFIKIKVIKKYYLEIKKHKNLYKIRHILID
ncbi:hypothetical protein HMPREF3230_00962, partial [Gardnerella vaginalis]